MFRKTFHVIDITLYRLNPCRPVSDLTQSRVKGRLDDLQRSCGSALLLNQSMPGAETHLAFLNNGRIQKKVHSTDSQPA